MSLQEPNATKKSVPKKEKITGGVSLKKSLAKKTKPKDTESNGKQKAVISPQPNYDDLNVLQALKQPGQLEALLQIHLSSTVQVTNQATSQIL